jgi:cell division septum initiation protein DivIVA
VSREFRLVSQDGETATAPAPPPIDLTQEEKPFLEMGYTIGRLLEDAHAAAEDMKRSAEQEAAVVLQEAGRNAARTKDEADRAARQAKSEATMMLDEARSAASRLSDQVAHERRLAEAEATVIRREASRDAKVIKGKARKEADAIVEAASGRAADRVRELEHRLRSLQRAESDLQKRISYLQSMRRSLEPEEEEAPEPTQ